MSGKKSCDKKDSSLVKRGISNVLSFVIVHAVAVVKLVEVHTVGLVSRHGKRCEHEHHHHEHEKCEEHEHEKCEHEKCHHHEHEKCEEHEDHEHEEHEEAKGKKRGCPIKYDEGSKHWKMVTDVYNVAKDGWTDLSKIKDGHKEDVTSFRKAIIEKFKKAM